MTAPPDWLAQLADQAAACIEAVEVLAPIGCHYYCNPTDGQWEVTLFASRTEVVGGTQDGLTTSSRFHMDLRGLLELFSEVHDFRWQALPLAPDDELGQHVSLEGTYEGQSVWLRIPAQAPERFDKGRNVNALEGSLQDLW